MKNRKPLLFGIILIGLSICCVNLYARTYQLTSPNGKLHINIEVDNGLRYDVQYDGQSVLTPSCISLLLDGGERLPDNRSAVSSAKSRSITEEIEAPFYRQKHFSISCNQIDIAFKQGVGVRFRAYDEGFAYSFYTTFKNDIIIRDELAEFNFAADHSVFAAYSTGKIDPFQMAFQNVYAQQRISEIDALVPIFAPLAIDLGGGRKMLISDGGQEAYPGMFLTKGDAECSVKGLFAPLPAEFSIDPRRCQPKVKSREEYIARLAGTSTLPWRIGIISERDQQLPVNNIIYALAPENRIGDVSWIKPGKIAWDWWNDWGITGVDFEVGINTATYKYLIDFASSKGIEYVVLDEGWSSPSDGDIMTVIPEIDLPEIVKYANQKNVGIVLWAVLDVLDQKLEEACALYSKMGVKGFKIDFLDRDDQLAMEQTYRVMDITAHHKLVIDLHGAVKPFGINRTYPHVLNVEGVFGLEELKWSNPDMPLYDVTMPFIRMAAGNVDYTQGAMSNANKKNFRSIFSAPMSQGTRAHQVAEYIVFDGPLVTLCDSPSAYLKEESCTDFIVSIPTVFDRTIIPAAKIGEYIVTARQSRDKWYVGALTNWDARKIEITLDFLDGGEYEVEILRDGINAASRGEDHVIEKRSIMKGETLSIDMAPGGGAAFIFTKKL